eukprot:Colp12_sorted_trinity150504_noHs@1993
MAGGMQDCTMSWKRSIGSARKPITRWVRRTEDTPNIGLMMKRTAQTPISSERGSPSLFSGIGPCAILKPRLINTSGTVAPPRVLIDFITKPRGALLSANRPRMGLISAMAMATTEATTGGVMLLRNCSPNVSFFFSNGLASSWVGRGAMSSLLLLISMIVNSRLSGASRDSASSSASSFSISSRSFVSYLFSESSGSVEAPIMRYPTVHLRIVTKIVNRRTNDVPRAEVISSDSSGSSFKAGNTKLKLVTRPSGMDVVFANPQTADENQWKRFGSRNTKRARIYPRQHPHNTFMTAKMIRGERLKILSTDTTGIILEVTKQGVRTLATSPLIPLQTSLVKTPFLAITTPVKLISATLAVAFSEGSITCSIFYVFVYFGFQILTRPLICAVATNTNDGDE